RPAGEGLRRSHRPPAREPAASRLGWSLADDREVGCGGALGAAPRARAPRRLVDLRSGCRRGARRATGLAPRRAGGRTGPGGAGGAAQAFAPASAAPRTAAVDQHVAGPRVAQFLELLCDVVGAAVHGAVLVDGPGITGGSIRTPVHRAVGPRGQLQLAHPILEP